MNDGMDIHFICRLGAGSVTDDDDRTSVISMNSSQDGETALLTGEMLMSRYFTLLTVVVIVVFVGRN